MYPQGRRTGKAGSSHPLSLFRDGGRAALCAAFMAQISAAQPPSYAIDGTSGAPLGGIGCGAVKYNAHAGTFAGTMITPCAIEDFAPTSMTGTEFDLYTHCGQSIVTGDPMKAVVTNGRSDDDAAYPVHYVNFGTTNGIAVTLTAFSPWNTDSVDQMCYPYAFYQFALTNTTAGSAEAAVAFQVKTGAVPVYVAGKGFKTVGGKEYSVYASADGTDGVITTGNDNGFLTSGQCNNTPSGTLNKVAVKVTLAANQTRTIRFVLAWYNGAENATYPDRYYYKNTFTGSNGVADFGLAHFDMLRTNAITLVSRMRASTIPAWLVNHCLVTLATLTNNSMYLKDGRYAFTEGMWNTNGTMDQMWHARQIYAQLVPRLNWQELQYWARTQKTTPAGQIHHDLGEHYNVWYLCPWDDQQHTDYRDIDAWVDLNCAFIISVYETFIATDDHIQLNYFWPYIRKAAQRILDQVALYGNTAYPGTFDGAQSSYDAGGNSNPYIANLTIPVYKIMSNLADLQGDSAVKNSYSAAYAKVVDSFKKRYLTNNFPSGRLCEAYMVGQWAGFFLKQGSFFDSASINYGLTAMNNYYHPLVQGLGYTGGSYDEWSIYLVAHLAGLNLLAGNVAEWRAFQYDCYERNFLDRSMVYNQGLGIPRKITAPSYLAASTSGFNTYLSLPVIWRNYYSIVGYYRNKHTGELWIEPIMLPEMNHSFTNALIISPEGYGTVSCSESGTALQTKIISYVPDKPVAITNLYVKDHRLATVFVSIDGVPYTPERTGSGYVKELKIAYNKTVPATGMQVIVSDHELGIRKSIADVPGARVRFNQTRNSFTIRFLGNGSHFAKVFTMQGSLVSRKILQGPCSCSFSASERGLAEGMYCVIVNSGEMNLQKTFVLCR